MNQDQYRIQQTIEKIDIFKGLDLEQVKHILNICHMHTYEPDQPIYRVGEPSDSMVTLLKGQLIVTTKTGDVLGSITQGMSSGEMGLFSGQPRSANVTATVQTTALVIDKMDLARLFAEDWELHRKVMQNVLDLMCKRMIGANLQIENYADTIRGGEPDEEVEEGSGEDGAPEEDDSA